MITLHKPSYIIYPGNTSINDSTNDYASSPEINRVKIIFNEEAIFDAFYNGESPICFKRNFIVDHNENYGMYVDVWDTVGNRRKERRTVQ